MIDKIKITSRSLYNHQAMRYVFVGGSTFLIDIALLYLLHQGFRLNIVISTALAYTLSIIYNFIMNRHWTFNAWEKESLKKHIVTYTALLSFNGLFTVLSVWLLSHIIYFGFAKVITVGVQITWTYPIYKYKIFTKKRG